MFGTATGLGKAFGNLCGGSGIGAAWLRHDPNYAILGDVTGSRPAELDFAFTHRKRHNRLTYVLPTSYLRLTYVLPTSYLG